MQGYAPDGACVDVPLFPRVAVIVIQIIFIAFLAPMSVLLLQLSSFHVYLSLNHLTTYAYILREGRKRLARQREALARHHEEGRVEAPIEEVSVERRGGKRGKRPERGFGAYLHPQESPKEAPFHQHVEKQET
jgi:hypothetical protein